MQMDSKERHIGVGLEIGMTKLSLDAGRLRLLEIIEELGFGRIEQLSIHNGQPCYERTFRIVEEIRLGSERERRPDHCNADLTMKKEFEDLFNRLSQLRNGIVDIGVRHSIPFRIVLERPYREFAAVSADKP